MNLWDFASIVTSRVSSRHPVSEEFGTNIGGTIQAIHVKMPTDSDFIRFVYIIRPNVSLPDQLDQAESVINEQIERYIATKGTPNATSG
jgi:hypothetical protein